MVVMVMGGSSSGKSAYAEEVAVKLKDKGQLYYLATMKVCDREGLKKIERHKILRQFKDFNTIEQYTDIALAGMHIQKNSTVLLEGLPNLVANEMFSEKQPDDEDAIVRKITEDIKLLSGGINNLILVTDNVFEGGCDYEGETEKYMKVLGCVAGNIAGFCDSVIEVTSGCQTELKSKKLTQSKKTPDNEVGKKYMELYIGGCNQGKLDYVKKKYQSKRYKLFDMMKFSDWGECLAQEIQTYNEAETYVIIINFNNWIKKCISEGTSPEDMLTELIKKIHRLIIISDEEGSGIVPADISQRQYRERLGRIQCTIAKEATKVERIICGMGQRLK